MLGSVGAVVVAIIALYKSNVTNKSLRNENKIRQIINDYLQLEYTEYHGGEAKTLTGSLALAQYLRTSIMSGELSPMPIKDNLDSCISRIEILTASLRLTLKNADIKQELTALNLQVITPILDIVNDSGLVNMPIMTYFQSINAKLVPARIYINGY